MSEKNRVVEFGPGARVNRQPLPPLHPQPQVQQVAIDLKNAVPRVCQNKIKRMSNDTLAAVPVEEICGSEFFVPVVKLYTISALLSPTGQELTGQLPVLVCQKCGEVVK